jgi:hypothetical protein
MAKDSSKHRTKVVALRLTPKMYDRLVDYCEGYGINPSTFCFLAVRKAISFDDDLNNPRFEKDYDSIMP